MRLCTPYKATYTTHNTQSLSDFRWTPHSVAECPDTLAALLLYASSKLWCQESLRMFFTKQVMSHCCGRQLATAHSHSNAEQLLTASVGDVPSTASELATDLACCLGEVCFMKSILLRIRMLGGAAPAAVAAASMAVACIGALGHQLACCRQLGFHKLAPTLQMKLPQQRVCCCLFQLNPSSR